MQREPVGLTVLIPCFNEARILPETVRQLQAYLKSCSVQLKGKSLTWEILFIDDGSADDSRAVLEALSTEHQDVRYISYPRNGGQGHALRTGFANAQGDWIFCVDADLDYGPEHIEKFFSVADKTAADIVVGSPYMPGGTAVGVPMARLFMSKSMNWYFSNILDLKIHTYTSILRLYRREAIQGILLTTRDKDVLPEILIKANLLGLGLVEAPAHLKWKAQIATPSRSGGGVLRTAGKAVRHFLWGAHENPLAFFAVPAIIVAMGVLWFGAATSTLVWDAYRQTTTSSLQALTQAASHVVLTNPQTVLIFALFLHAALMLFTVSLVTLQNKMKSEQDFIYFSQISSALNAIRQKTDKPE